MPGRIRLARMPPAMTETNRFRLRAAVVVLAFVAVVLAGDWLVDAVR
jgi:hypothetical protein